MLLLWISSLANSATFVFDADPFQGSTAPTTPGRQIVGGEPSIEFDIANDVFAFDPAVFDPSAFAGGGIVFASGLASTLPTSGANVIVLRNTGDPFNAGVAASLVADQVTTPGAGFFVYFNSGLNLPRLVYSTDLSSSIADLKILARMTNLIGDSAALADFTAANFAPVPEPSSYVLLLAGGALVGTAALRRRRAGRA